MPTTKAGKKVLASMQKQYGKKKGKAIYFASIVKGKKGSEKWEGKGGTGKLAKAKRTYARKRGKKSSRKTIRNQFNERV